MVRAKPLDLITIKRMLDTVIDVGPGGSKAVMKPFFIGPLQYAVATEVVNILKEVYRESTNQASSQAGIGRRIRLRPVRRFGGFGGARQQPLDAMGRPKQVSLSIAADDRTNSIVGMATELMAKDIEKVVQVIEEKAKDSTKVVQLVPTGSIDPLLVQEVIDAIQGRHSGHGGAERGPDGQPVHGRQPVWWRWRLGPFGQFGGGNRVSAATRVGLAAADRPVRRNGGGRRDGRRPRCWTVGGGGRGFREPPDLGTMPGCPRDEGPIFLNNGTWMSRSRPSSTIRTKK